MSEEGYINVCNFGDSLSIWVTSAPNSPGGQEPQSPRRPGLTFDSRDKEALLFTALKVFDPVAAARRVLPIIVELRTILSDHFIAAIRRRGAAPHDQFDTAFAVG